MVEQLFRNPVVGTYAIAEGNACPLDFQAGMGGLWYFRTILGNAVLTRRKQFLTRIVTVSYDEKCYTYE